VEPWNGYTLDDARSNPRNWQQAADGTWTYVGGSAAIGGDPTIPPPTSGYGGYDPLSSADYLYAPGSASGDAALAAALRLRRR
jgi:hypothetical protein